MYFEVFKQGNLIIRGKQIPPEKEGMINLAGFALMMALAIFVAYNDVIKLIK